MDAGKHEIQLKEVVAQWRITGCELGAPLEVFGDNEAGSAQPRTDKQHLASAVPALEDVLHRQRHEQRRGEHEEGVEKSRRQAHEMTPMQEDLWLPGPRQSDDDVVDREDRHVGEDECPDSNLTGDSALEH